MGKGSDWIRAKTREVLKGFLSRQPGNISQPALNQAENITFTNGQKTKGKTDSGIKVDVIPMGRLRTRELGIMVGPKQFLCKGPSVRYKTIDGSLLTGYYLVENDDSTRLYIRKANQEDGTGNSNWYEIEDLPEEGFIPGQFYSGFKQNYICNKPCFSPSGRHIFIPCFPNESNISNAEIKFILIKNFTLITRESDNKKIVSGTRTTHTVSLNQFTSSLETAGYPSPPSVNEADLQPLASTYKRKPLYSDMMTQSTYYTAETDPEILDVFPTSGLTYYTLCGYDNIAYRRIPEDAFLFQADYGFFFWFTEDSQGNPKVDIYSKYIARSTMYKVYHIDHFESDSDCNTGYTPFVVTNVAQFGSPLIFTTQGTPVITAMGNPIVVNSSPSFEGPSSTTVPTFEYATPQYNLQSGSTVFTCLMFHLSFNSNFSNAITTISGSESQIIAANGANVAGVDAGLGGDYAVFFYTRRSIDPHTPSSYSLANYDWSAYNKLLFFARISNPASGVNIPADSMTFVVNPQYEYTGSPGFFGNQTITASMVEYPIKHAAIAPGAIQQLVMFEVDFGGPGPSQVQGVGLQQYPQPALLINYAVAILDEGYILSNLQGDPTYSSATWDQDTEEAVVTLTVNGEQFFVRLDEESFLMNGFPTPSFNTEGPLSTSSQQYDCIYGGTAILSLDGGTVADPDTLKFPNTTLPSYYLMFMSFNLSHGICKISNLQSESPTIISKMLGNSENNQITENTGNFYYNSGTGTSAIHLFQGAIAKTSTNGNPIFDMLDGFTAVGGGSDASVIQTYDLSFNPVEVEYRVPAILGSAQAKPNISPSQQYEEPQRLTTDQKYIPPPDLIDVYENYIIRQTRSLTWMALLCDDGEEHSIIKKLTYNQADDEFVESNTNGKVVSSGNIIDWTLKT